jgi:hypothetical protein
MTTEGRAAYQVEWNKYVYEDKDYKEHRANLEKLTSWVLSTTSTTLKKTCCKEGETMDKWYKAFRETGQAYEDNRIPDAKRRYTAAVKPLTKLPRAFDAWITEWETAIAEGEHLDLPDTSSAQFWAADLVAALRPVNQSWATTFTAINKAAIKENKLSYREVAADLRRDWAVQHQSKASVAKGAFPSFGAELDRNATVESEPEGGEEEPTPKKKPTAKAGKGKRKRTNTGTAKGADAPATQGGGSCRACLGDHQLPNCFYAFPEKAPEGWRPSLTSKRLVSDRIKESSTLAEEIKRLRKGKDKTTDDS